MYIKISIKNYLLELKAFDNIGQDITNTLSNTKIELYNFTSKGYEYISTHLVKSFNIDTKTLASLDAVYVNLYINDVLYKKYLKVQIINDMLITSYSISYTVKTLLSKTNNSLLDRYNYFMPKWSTAYKNDISVFSKIYSALFEPVEKALYRSKSFNTLNVSGNNIIKYKQVNLPFDLKYVRSNDVFLSEAYTKEKNSITEILLEESYLKVKNIFSNILLQDISFPLIMNKNFSHLFIKASGDASIIISGFDLNNNHCVETILLNTNVPFMTKFKYSKINEITTSNRDILISNYIDCISNLNFQKFNESSLNIGFDKGIEDPEVIFDSENSRVNYYYIKPNSKISSLKDSYLLPSTLNIIKLYISSDNDILVLTDIGDIYTGLIRKNLEINMPLTTYNNNNIYLSAPKTLTNNSVEFQINFNFLKQDYGNISAKILLQTDTQTLYLNEVGDWSVDQKFIVISNPNPMYVEVEIDESEYCSLILELESGEIFQASVRNDKIKLYKKLSNVSNIFSNGEDLYITSNSANYRAIVNKDYYEYTNNSVKYIGEKPLTIYDTKGLIINV